MGVILADAIAFDKRLRRSGVGMGGADLIGDMVMDSRHQGMHRLENRVSC